MVAKSLAALGVLLLLLYIDPILATLTTLVLGGAYGVLFLSIRKHQRHLGELRLVANSERFEVLSDGFGGIKELMLLGRTNHVVTRFSGPSHAFASATAMNAVIGQLPRFAFESLAFGGIVLMVVYFLGSNRDFQSVVPVLGLYGFAAYRLMPSLQMIFLSMTTIRFNTAALEKLLEEVPEASHSFSEPRLPVSSPLPLSQGIRFSDVGFRYPRAKSELFVSLNFYLQAGQSVAFVGPTGSGKSTIADLILGLLDPTEGTIEVDGLALRGDVLRRWQANLGYVPQSIFLANQTIARNIAFGLPTDEVDLQAVEKAAKTAHIHSFIKNELPEGYETVTGERGVRLSGGQRQRIGIARALYGNPGILIFDEATSALDSVTEESIVRATQELSKDRTVITIAHRFSTVRHCDCIFLLDNGRLLASGPYDYLISTSKAFRDLASSSSG
jgi:ATP-binding cassette subfamily C protein